jgi:hypothetical protein
MTNKDTDIVKDGRIYKCKNFFPRLKFPEKYLREDKKLTARSKMEMTYFENFDRNKNIIQWNSENIAIPYEKPIFDGICRIVRFELRNYFPDIYLILKHKDGTIEEILGEIKPEDQLYAPKKPLKETKKSMKNYMNKMCTYNINVSKWKSANKFVQILRTKKNRNINFYFFTTDKVISYNEVFSK